MKVGGGAGLGTFRNGSSTSTSHADFDQFYTPISSYSQGTAGGTYTVRAGESLSSIAAQLWGDSALWYKIAEANGLSASSALATGQTLRLPSNVMRNTHSAATFQPYDPGEAIGNTAPTTPKPPKDGNCGVVVQIVIVTIAVMLAIALL